MRGFYKKSIKREQLLINEFKPRYPELPIVCIKQYFRSLHVNAELNGKGSDIPGMIAYGAYQEYQTYWAVRDTAFYFCT